MEQEIKSFGALIAPLSTDDFFAHYWEKTFLHLQNGTDRFSAYFSLRDVDRWLASTRSNLYVTPPRGSAGQTSVYRPQEISMSMAYTFFGRGHSLVMEGLEDRASLQGLVKALGKEFHAGIAVEAFVTPPEAKPFPTHAAGHDLLILNVEGEKVWQLHEFSLLQFNPSQKTNFRFPLEWYGRTQTPVIAELCLKPGDLLFIPRGMPHQAVSQTGACLHLSLGITSFLWTDFLKVAAEIAALHSQELRRALPPDFVEGQDVHERMRQTFQDVLKVFLEKVSFDETLAAVSRNRVTRHGFPSDGHFSQLVEPAELTADSEVERRPDLLCFVDELVDIEKKTRSVIYFGTEQVMGPRHLRRALEFVRDHTRFRVSEIPGLDGKGQIALTRRLIKEGLLRRDLPAKP